MGALIQLNPGDKFARWTVIERGANRPCGRGTQAHWICQCECGIIREVSGMSLRKLMSKSCGCLQTYLLKQRGWKYTGEVTSREFTWNGKTQTLVEWSRELNISLRAMIGRVHAGDDTDMERLFRPTVAQQKAAWSLGITPGTLWQKPITLGSESKFACQWAAEKGIPEEMLLKRLDRGWSVEQALKMPKEYGAGPEEPDPTEQAMLPTPVNAPPTPKPYLSKKPAISDGEQLA